MSFDEVFERRTRQERDITVQQNERAAGISQNLFGGQERMGRPKLWFLHHKSEPAVPQERLFHLRRLIPDDDGRRLRFECGGGRQDVFDERESGHPVQHLRTRRFHPRAFAGSENGDVKIHVLIAWGPTSPHRGGDNPAAVARRVAPRNVSRPYALIIAPIAFSTGV